MVAGDENSPSLSLTPDLLADLHGDVLSRAEAERVRAAVDADPDAGEVIAALDRVRDELAALRTAPNPAPPAPADVMARITAALEAEPLPVTDLAARRRARLVTAVTAAAAVALVAVGAAAVLRDTGAGGTDAGLLADSAAPAVDLGDDLSPAAVLGMLGRPGDGRPGDRERRSECLRANGFDEETTVLGTGAVTLHGRTGTLLLLPGPQSPTITALVVGKSCSANDPDTIARTDIG